MARQPAKYALQGLQLEFDESDFEDGGQIDYESDIVPSSESDDEPNIENIASGNHLAGLLDSEDPESEEEKSSSSDEEQRDDICITDGTV